MAMGSEAQALDPAIPDIAIRLADEGVPLRAIARAIKQPSNLVRERLRRAQETGRLLDLPRDDWPPGFPRDQRALQLSRLVTENRDLFFMAIQQLFGLSPTEIGLLLSLVQQPSLLRDRATDTMTPQTVYVHVCRIRQRLAPHGIEIKTSWGHGYHFSPGGRRKVMKLILRQVAAYES
jgi:hypothetical protein